MLIKKESPLIPRWNLIPLTSLMVLALVIILCFQFSCGSGKELGEITDQQDGSDQKSYGDTLIAAYTADPQSLNFVSATDKFSNIIARLMTDSLIYHDQHLNIIPKLAESWDISEDRKTITFHLRKNARWHDGVPVTAEDAKFTYEKIIDPSSLATNKIAQFKDVEEVSVPDPYTLKVKYKEPFSPALVAWNVSLIPKHLFEKELDFIHSRHHDHPIGCGPFKFVQWDRTQKIVLEANDQYWDGRPYLDRIIFKIIPSEQVRFEAVLTGDIDYAILSPLNCIKDAERIEFKTRLRTFMYNPIYLWFIGWNMDGSNPFFTDKRVRQAMTYAMDREGFLRNVYFGLGKVAITDFQPDTWAFDDTIEPYPYDLERAKLLLDEAGWKDSNGNRIRDKNGIEFEFTLIFPAGSETSVQMASLFKESLERIGVKMNLIKLEWSTFSKRRKSHAFQASMSGIRKDIDPDPYEIWHSSQYENGANYGGYYNPEADKLIEEGRREFDRNKRKEIYKKLQKILHEDQPYSFLFHPSGCVAIDRRFKGVITSPAGIWQFYPSVKDWWIPASEQKY